MRIKASDVAREFHQRAAVLRQEAHIKQREAKIWDLAAMDVERIAEQEKNDAAKHNAEPG